MDAVEIGRAEYRVYPVFDIGRITGTIRGQLHHDEIFGAGLYFSMKYSKETASDALHTFSKVKSL